MPDLSFAVETAEAVPFAAAPLLAIKLRISCRQADEAIHTIALRCQIMIDPTRRNYKGEDQSQLRDLFGEPERWGQTLRPLLWTHTSSVVPSFTGSTVVDLPVPCTYDFNVAATKYFAGLSNGEIPLNLLFSGTVFYAGEEGYLQVTQIPWDKEALYRMPVQVWKAMMEMYYPNVAWLGLRKDVFDRLYRFKVRHGIPTWEQAVERLLLPVGEEESDKNQEDEGSELKENVH